MTKMTKEQLDFVEGIERLKALNSLDRPLTDSEVDEENIIKFELFEKIAKYGMQIANQMMTNNNLASDAYDDVKQELATMFYSKLDSYDPTLAAPTTYFKKYFQEAIHNYLLKYSQNLSQYDSSNLKKVNKAINHYESQGIKWNEELLANQTGLSIKVIKSTLYIGQNSKRADISEAIWLPSALPTPEEVVENSEIKLALYEAMKRNINSDNLKLVALRLNVPEPQIMPYTKISKITGIPVYVVKKRLKNAFHTLKQDPTLIAELLD